MSTAARAGLLTVFAIDAVALALVQLLPLDPLWLVAALVVSPLAGALVHAGLTRRAMGLTGPWEPGRAAERLTPGNASVRGIASSFSHSDPGLSPADGGRPDGSAGGRG